MSLKTNTQATNTQAPTRSFRLTNDVYDKLREAIDEIGGSQQHAISQLVEIYELQKGKVVLADKKDDIETFENYINALTRMYMTTLEENQNTKELVRTEYDAQLTSKDDTIQDLQKQLSSSKKTEKKAVEDADALQAENQRLNDCINTLKAESENKIKNLENMLSDKEKLNTALAETVEQQKLQITGTEEKANEMEKLKAKVIECQNQLQDAEKAMEQQQLQHKNDILELKEKLQNEKAEEIAKYQKLYFDMMQEKKPKTTRSTRATKSKKESSASNEDESENENSAKN